MQAYHKTDQQIHQLAQIIAKVNRTYVPPKPDDSHTNLHFDPVQQRLLGRWIDSSHGKIMLGLHLEDFSFAWLSPTMHVLEQSKIKGKNIQEIEANIEKSLANYGLNKKGFRDELHFEIPLYPFLKEKCTPFDRDGLQQWLYIRMMAHWASHLLLDMLQLKGEVRIWPHHFDTGIYAEPSDTLGLGFGLAMKDSQVNNPYFYFSGYGLNGHVLKYTRLNTLSKGKWITDKNWKGAILPVNSLHDPAMDDIILFIKQAAGWYLGII